MALNNSIELNDSGGGSAFKNARYGSNVGQTATATTGLLPVSTDVQYDVDVETDTHVTKAVGNDEFTINEDGNYLIKASIRFLNAISSTSYSINFGLSADAVSLESTRRELTLSTGTINKSEDNIEVSWIGSLTSGQVVKASLNHKNSANSNRALESNQNSVYIQITKIS